MDGLLEQGLITAINKRFQPGSLISNDDRSANPDAIPLKLGRIYEKLYQHVPVNIKVEDPLFIKMLTGKIIIIPYNAADTGCVLIDDRTLADYNIQRKSTLLLVRKFRGGGFRHYYIDTSEYDTQWNFDFRDIQTDSAPFARGGKPYTRPLGSMRYAVKVLDKYSDNSWLGAVGNRTHSDEGEWPVAYHGTKEMNVSEIVKKGLRLEMGRRFLYGRGIYCTPDPKTALQYAETYSFQGKQYRLILQTRVNPNELVVVKKKDNLLGEYWVLPNETGIRPYGVCVYPGVAVVSYGLSPEFHNIREMAMKEKDNNAQGSQIQYALDMLAQQAAWGKA